MAISKAMKTKRWIGGQKMSGFRPNLPPKDKEDQTAAISLLALLRSEGDETMAVKILRLLKAFD